MGFSLLAVFAAGLLSFLSPCVLPLVPGYVSMLSGIGVEQLKEGEGSSAKLFGTALAFVIGFSIVFITFGATASAVGSFMLRNKAFLAPVAGALIVLFGLHLIGWLAKISVKWGLVIAAVLIIAGIVLNIGADYERRLIAVQLYAVSLIFLLGPTLTRWLNRDLHLRNVGGSSSGGSKPGIISGFLLGFAFAFGWTPCIGPIIGGVLLIASTRNTVGEGVMLLAVYSAGLAVPFLLFALGIGRFLKFYQKFRKYLHAVEVGSGVLLLFIGALIFFNHLTWLSGHLGFLNRFVQ